MNAHFIFTQPMPSPSQDLIRRHRAKIYHVPLGMHGAKTENLGGKLNGNPNKKFWIFSLWDSGDETAQEANHIDYKCPVHEALPGHQYVS